MIYSDDGEKNTLTRSWRCVAKTTLVPPRSASASSSAPERAVAAITSVPLPISSSSTREREEASRKTALQGEMFCDGVLLIREAKAEACW